MRLYILLQLVICYCRYITDENSLFDWHWGPFQRLCQPCSLPYSFISKVETFSQDSKYLVSHRLARGRQSHIPTMNSKRREAIGDSNNRSYTRLLPQYSQITDSLFERLIDICQLDMQMFGYSYSRDA